MAFGMPTGWGSGNYGDFGYNMPSTFTSSTGRTLQSGNVGQPGSPHRGLAPGSYGEYMGQSGMLSNPNVYYGGAQASPIGPDGRLDRSFRAGHGGTQSYNDYQNSLRGNMDRMNFNGAQQISNAPGKGGMIGNSANAFTGQASPVKQQPQGNGWSFRAKAAPSFAASAGTPQPSTPMPPPQQGNAPFPAKYGNFADQGYGSALEMFRAQQQQRDPSVFGQNNPRMPYAGGGHMGPNSMPRRASGMNPAPGQAFMPGGSVGTHKAGGYGNQDPNRPNLSGLAPWLTQRQFR